MVSIFSTLELELLARFKSGEDPVYSLAVTMDDTKLVTGGRSINVWEIKGQTRFQTFTGHANEVRRLVCVENNEVEVILSSAADDRNISVWKLDERAKKKMPAYITLLVNEYISDLACLVVDDEILTTVTTVDGSVLIYRYSLFGARRAQVKCSSLVEIGAQEDRKVTKVQICASFCLNQDSPSLHIAYGSAFALQIEELKINELGKTHILARSSPVPKPSAPSLMSDQHILENKTSLKKRKQEIDKENMTLEERLDKLKLNQTKDSDKPETLAQLLVQGLQSKDPRILGGVLDREDEDLIRKIIASLPTAFVIPLLRHIYSEVKGKGINHISTAKWIGVLVKTHFGYLISSPSVIQDILIPLNNIMEQRTANYLEINRKKEEKKNGVRVQPYRPPLIVYESNGEDEESVLEELDPMVHCSDDEEEADEPPHPPPAPTHTHTPPPLPPIRRSKRKCKSELEKEKILDIEARLLATEDSLDLKEQEIYKKGRGVVTLRSYKKGEFVLEYAGELINKESAKHRETQYSLDTFKGCYMYYFKYKDKQYCIDATKETGRLGRLVNHSCKAPNCVPKVFTLNNIPRVILVALQDIEKDTELLFDYGDRCKESLKNHPWLML
ncbi:WD repeat-containing protein 43 isoform X2 [Eurytemora carolleeae]|uniref:WD repeat-containing protein 43 isoform X2 n=1 Tax=Eurytemora carolleeae TaxID=1294199 RepID=UPI000C78A40D|nr:WD repeat-containing protein 43 isoform X2 [Eurytemora carolleeae]|eukprot:XP_023322755.1 WD repeat-containing protein 43-like isoform X2 [Eurytemora affinis]